MTSPQSHSSESLLIRLHRALGPVASGIILDVLDFATFGPLGLVLGFVTGFSVGWWIASIEEQSPWMKFILACLSGLYMTVPFTEIIPLATLVVALVRVRGRPSKDDVVTSASIDNGEPGGVGDANPS